MPQPEEYPPTAREIYEEQLGLLGIGYPLWSADPINVPPVDIADVSYIKYDGGWVKLFNAAKELDEDNPCPRLEDIGPFISGRRPGWSPLHSRSIVSIEGDVTFTLG